MKRLLIGSIIVAVTIAVIIAAVPFLISSELVKRRVADQVTEWTGREVALRGEPIIALFPYLTVKLKDVSVAGASNSPGDQ